MWGMGMLLREVLGVQHSPQMSLVVVVVEGKLTDVTPGNWKVQGWNSEGKESLLFPFF